MRIGVTFPQTEIGSDPVAIRDWAQAVEGLGFTHILAYDHVARRGPREPARLARPRTRSDTPFHEPFVLFGYLAARHQRSRARHRRHHPAAAADGARRQAGGGDRRAHRRAVAARRRRRLERGRVRGAGRELPQSRRAQRGADRGAARALDRQAIVTFDGRVAPRSTTAGHQPAAGAAPDPDLDRRHGRARCSSASARIGDGWFPQRPPDERGARDARASARYAARAGRDPATIGIEARVSIGGKNPDDWAREVEGWRELGATHLSVNTMKAGLHSPQEHIDAIRRFKEAVGA